MSKISIKPGVRIQGISPEMSLGHTIVASIYLDEGHVCTITSALEGVHSRASIHYTGNALDYRTRDVSAGDMAVLTERIRVSLGEDFDVILERNHLHVEFQPKTSY